MKVQIAYIVDGKPGREAWVIRKPEGLAFGNIYQTKEDAAELDESEIDWLEIQSDRRGDFFVYRILKN